MTIEWVRVAWTGGTIDRSSGVLNVNREDVGRYRISFSKDISGGVSVVTPTYMGNKQQGEPPIQGAFAVTAVQGSDLVVFMTMDALLPLPVDSVNGFAPDGKVLSNVPTDRSFVVMTYA